MNELILVKNQLKSELALEKGRLELWKSDYEKQKFQSTLQQIRYTEGIIEGLEKAIKRIEDNIKMSDAILKLAKENKDK